MAWGRRYGLKGMIDASVRVRTNTNSAEANEVIMPLEFKTGKGTSGQVCLLPTPLCKRVVCFLVWPHFTGCSLTDIFFTVILFSHCFMVQAAMEHSAQVMLYTLLMSERCVISKIFLHTYIFTANWFNDFSVCICKSSLFILFQIHDEHWIWSSLLSPHWSNTGWSPYLVFFLLFLTTQYWNSSIYILRRESLLEDPT